MSPDPGPALVRLHVQGSRLTRLVAPTVLVDGVEHPVGFGANHIGVGAGAVHVECRGEWAGTPTSVSATVTAGAGDVVDLWYAQPSTRAPQGAIGLEPHRARSVRTIATIVALVVVVVLLAGILPVLIGGA